ncbi:MAG: hypothetical protein ACRC2B_04090 [Rubrivivax sp.]
MSGEHELPTASVVRSSQATPARRRGQLFADVRPAGLHLSKLVRCSDNRDHLYPPMPFDGKRMIFGGFEQVVEVKA